MKQTTTLWSLLLTLLMAVTASTAQETVTSRLQAVSADATLRAGATLSGFGYADRTSDRISYLGVGKTGLYLSTYILLPDVGANKIEQISFPAAKADKHAYILILSEDGKKTLYNQPCEIASGVNQIALTTPFAIEAGKRYLVGFATKAVGDDEEKDPWVIPFDGTFGIRDAQYMAYGTDPYPTKNSTAKEFNMFSAQGYGSALVFVKLQDESKLQSVGYFLWADGDFKLVKTGAEIPTEVAFYNSGMQDITSFEVSYRFGNGETKILKRTLQEPLKPAKAMASTIKIPAEMEGMGTLHVALTKVNEQDNIFASYSNQLPYQIGNSAAIDRETVLLERFSTERCPNCPPADRYVKDNIKQFQAAGLRVSYIVYHSGFFTDFLTTNESEELYVYFFDEGSFAPAMSINRTFIPSRNALVHSAAAYPSKEWVPRVKSDKQGVRIERIDQKIDNQKLTAVVSGVALKDSFDPEDLYLTVIVTEDNIPAKAQQGAKRGYKHNAVPRLFLTAPTGDKLQVQADGTFSVKLEGTLLPMWDGSQCKVVAFAHSSVTQSNRRNRTVHTAETAQLGFPLANAPVAPAQAPIVTVEDGYINIQGPVDAFELYDMSGTLVTTSVETRLLPGTYIVRTFSNLHVYTSKVIVR